MAGDFGGQAHSDTAGAIQQREGQTRGQLARLFKGAVVVWRKVDRALVQLFKQQRGDARQPRFGVAHRCRPVAIARAEITLAVDQRITLAEVLRHAHHRVVSRLVAMRVVFTQHIADHTRTFDRLGAAVAVGPAKAQAHARHAVQNAPLHRLLAVTHIGQRAPLDHAQRIFKVGTLRVRGKRVLVSGFRIGRFGVCSEKIHCYSGQGKDSGRQFQQGSAKKLCVGACQEQSRAQASREACKHPGKDDAG